MSNTAKSCKAGYYYCFTDRKCKKIPLGWHVGRGGYLSRDDEEDSNKKNGNGNEESGSEGGNGGGQVSEEAVSKSQQRFFGMVRAAQKGEMEDPSPEVAKAASSMSKSDVKDFAKTKHNKLPEKKKVEDASDGGSPYREYKPKPQPKPSQPPEGFDAFRKKYLNKKMNEEKHDHEHEMIRRQMDTVTSAAKRLKKKVGKRGEGNVKAWVQSKITKAADYIDTAADYMDSEVKEENIDEANKKCWKGYKKAGTQKLFGKTYNRCVKKEETCPICNEDPCICLEGNLEEGNKSGDTSLRDWFSKSRSSDGTPGWVQLGGKYAGKPCARQPGQKTKPKCGSSKMKRNLNKDEERAAFLRKQRQDPNPNRKGKAKNVATEDVVLENQMTNIEKRNQEVQRKQIQLDRQKIALKRKALQVNNQSKPDNQDNEMIGNQEQLNSLKVRESAEIRYCPKCKKPETRSDCRYGVDYWDANSKAIVAESGLAATYAAVQADIAHNKKMLDKSKMSDGMKYALKKADERKHDSYATGTLDTQSKISTARADAAKHHFAQERVKRERARQAILNKDKEGINKFNLKKAAKISGDSGDRVKTEGVILEVKDKKGKGSDTKDACYHKVKSRYSVWPSAYASGALVKCRKKGAKNWGNKSEEILAGIAAQYLFNEGVNEEGVDIFIEELGLEQFASFVEGITADTYLTEARAARKARKGAKTYDEVKAEIDARERAKKKPSTQKTKAAAETAKKQQPKKRPILDGIARQVLKGMERHKAAMSAARETGKTISKAAQVGAGGAKEFGKGFKSGIETAGKVSKVAYKTLNKED